MQTELIGGARIHHVLNNIFVATLDKIDSLEGISGTTARLATVPQQRSSPAVLCRVACSVHSTLAELDIRVAIYNSGGIRHRLFMQDGTLYSSEADRACTPVEIAAQYLSLFGAI